ncbi:alpha/beta hydrolase family esterase [Caldimonas brevitalea]|uniref:Poly(3-hydroxyalkanoate) depolymerase n=1 Tax=Caldimonas brevitalea TaxID=413882 RepID=A0A0G3BH43_9BURK|nr:PHB depolymerase family esterase [Caldimonas brevitalea]AKJ26701.1 poly(3-hydroxyalkanoate) depolymerase [Caldimonas brevitalea]
MHPDFQHWMKEATRLTQAGDLQGATAALQAALGQRPPAGAAPAAARQGAARVFADQVIDVEAREVVDAVEGAPADVTSMPPPSGRAETMRWAESLWRRAPASTPPTDGATRAKEGSAAGGRFISGSHADPAAGQRDYKLFIPPVAGPQPRPLVVMLHGCTQSPDDFATGTAMNEAASAQGFFVLYPAQSAQANPQRCWNWFKHHHQQRDRGEAALIAGMVRRVMREHSIDSERVYVAGLSAGGAMAAILGAAYPELFAAVGVHSGLAAGSATDLPSALAAMRSGGNGQMPGRASRMPTIVFHGDADTTVHPRNAEQVIAASVGVDTRVEPQTVAAAGGRTCTRRIHRATDGQVVAEHWLVHGAGHAWSGGSARGSYTDARGPDASAEMVRFFLEQRRRRSD